MTAGEQRPVRVLVVGEGETSDLGRRLRAMPMIEAFFSAEEGSRLPPDIVLTPGQPVPRTIAGTAPVLVISESQPPSGTAAFEWLPSSASAEELERALRNAIEKHTLVTALAESEERFRLLTEYATDIIGRSAPDGTILYVSPAAAHVIGVDPAVAIGRSVFENVHPEDLERVVEANARAVSGESPVVVQYRRRRTHANDWYWFESSSRGVFDDQTGTCLEIRSVTRDVTGRQHAEERVRESEARFRAMVEASPESIAVVGLDGGFHWTNGTFANALDYSNAELSGTGAYSLVHPEDLPHVSSTLQRVVASGPDVTEEITFRMRHARGHWATIEAHGRTFAGADGSVAGIVVIFRDITLRRAAEESLRESEQRYRDLFENATDILFTLDPDGKFTSANHAAESATGYDHWELLGMNVAEIIAPEHLEDALAMRYEALKHGQSKGIRELDLLSRDGTRVSVEVRIRSLGPEGAYTGMQGIARDITARREAELLLRTVANRAPIGMYIVVDRRFVFVNPQFCLDTGYSEDDLIDHPAIDLVIPEHREMARARAIEMLKGIHSGSSEFKVRTHSGETRWFLETVNPIQYRGQRAALGCVLDITDRKRAEDRLTRQAFYDELTGLPNRSRFMEKLEEALSRDARPGAVATLFLDLDGFKEVNDSLGHTAGDELLGHVGRRLTRCVRPLDTVARLGGDEFTVLLQGIGHESEALAVAERIIEALARPFVLGDHEAEVTVSVGVSFSAPESTAGDMLREADIALYNAKSDGKNRYAIFDRPRAERAA